MKRFIKRFLQKIKLYDYIEECVGFWRKISFKSADYWEKRYEEGGNSGTGSYNHLADFKADYINELIKKLNVQKVIEFGCGDGNQLSLLEVPHYVGIDVSRFAVNTCRSKYKNDSTKKFFHRSEYNLNEKGDFVLSLDVIYHLVEDDIYHLYMHALFNASTHYVVIYSSNFDSDRISLHMKHRKFTDWIELNLSNWKLLEFRKNDFPDQGDYRKGSCSDFYVFEIMDHYE
jgi:cyclopropane fatty-acyl-phospholipid synthase-like methyltransferase